MQILKYLLHDFTIQSVLPIQIFFYTKYTSLNEKHLFSKILFISSASLFLHYKIRRLIFKKKKKEILHVLARPSANAIFLLQSTLGIKNMEASRRIVLIVLSHAQTAAGRIQNRVKRGGRGVSFKR